MNRPEMSYGLRHVALYVRDLPACERFYVDLLGMKVEWRPDQRNIYLSSGSDNLALHQAAAEITDEAVQRLDHIGFFLATASLVDEWFAWLREQGVPMRTEPRTHRDGARSFYCCDPDGTLVQIIFHPPVRDWEARRG
ncbi:MAG TPA: VOC family protein [Thiolapillus brandeum]|uniref:VOC family protein n=1 Tax=Thiolapillus brandeum TaxID=1076588 RepID=A0A831WAX7_9GAMM|nr:VOC family protein [Thiolapillus brandeum]